MLQSDSRSELQLFQALLFLHIAQYCYLLTSFIVLAITPFWDGKHSAFSYLLSCIFTNLGQKQKAVEAYCGLADLSSMEKLFCTNVSVIILYFC